jgi:hypothetical protein
MKDIDMTLQNKLIALETLTRYRRKNVYTNPTDNHSSAELIELQPSHGYTAVAQTHVLKEAWHGMWYGAGIGLLIGAYILFFPLWITVSPAWYTSAHWYVILTITTITSMLLLGLSAAVLGSHVLSRRRIKVI